MVPLLTDIDTIDVGGEFPPKTEQPRINRYDKNRKLWKGKHQDVFEGWDRLLTRHDMTHTVKLILNFHKRSTLLWCDLMIGKAPRFIAGKENTPVQKQIEEIVRRTDLRKVAYKVAIDRSRFGDGIFKTRLENGLAVIEGKPPGGWYPIMDRENLERVQAHVMAWTFTREINTWAGFGKPRDQEVLRVEIHARGAIINRAFELRGKKITAELDITEVTEGEKQVEQETGVEDFLITPVTGVLTTEDVHGEDDYEALDSILHEMEIRLSQNSRIMDKHADPNLAGPQSVLDTNPLTRKGRMVAGGRYMPIEHGEQMPQYITWDGNLGSSFTQFEKLMEQLYLISETSPAAFGQMDSGVAESGSALRRLLMAPLLKTQRLQGEFDPALLRVIQNAMALEGTVLKDPVTIQWKDGLPKDLQEVVNIEVARVGALVSSRRSAIARIDEYTDSEVDAEMKLIEEEQKQAAELEKAKQPDPPPPPAPPEAQGGSSPADDRSDNERSADSEPGDRSNSQENNDDA